MSPHVHLLLPGSILVSPSYGQENCKHKSRWKRNCRGFITIELFRYSHIAITLPLVVPHQPLENCRRISKHSFNRNCSEVLIIWTFLSELVQTSIGKPGLRNSDTTWIQCIDVTGISLSGKLLPYRPNQSTEPGICARI